MVLQKQNVNISFSKGIDTINDPYLVESDRFLAIENGVFLKNGSLKKRYGFDKIGMGLINSANSIENVKKLALFNDSLVALAKGKLYSYANERDQWTEKGTFSTVDVNATPIVRNNNTQTNFDFARVDDLDVYVWQQGNDIYYSVSDSLSNANIVKDTRLHDGTTYAGSMPQIGVIGDNILFFYWVAEATDKMYVKIITTGTPDSITTVTTPVANVTSGDRLKPYQVISKFSGVLLAHQDSSAQQIIFKYVNKDGVANPPLFPTETHTQTGHYTSHSMSITSTDDAFLVYYNIDRSFGTVTVSGSTVTLNSSGEIDYFSSGQEVSFYDASGSSVASTTVVSVNLNLGTFVVADPTGITNGDSVYITSPVPRLDVFRRWLPDNTDTLSYTSIALPQGVTGKASLYYSSTSLLNLVGSDIIASDPREDATVRSYDLTITNPNISDLSTFSVISSDLVKEFFCIGLASNLFYVNGSLHYVMSYQGAVADADNLQPTHFMIDWAGNCVAKILPSLAGNHTTMLANVTVVGDKGYYAAGERTRLISQNGILLTATGVTKIEANFGSESFQVAQLGENLHITGGFLYNYDGQTVVEHGFHLFPEKPTVVAGTSGSLTGAYQYCLVYEWIDSRGQLHQSAPSVPSDITVSGHKVVIASGYYVPITAKQDARIVIYRTVNAGTTFYRVDDMAMQDNWTYVDDIPDTTIEKNMFLYTTGGTLENIAPPSCSIITRHNNRLFLAGLEDTTTIWYSKESVENEAVAFSDLLYLKVNPAGGAITALASLDDKLIIFKEDSIYALPGQGPTDAGTNNDFVQPQFITGNIGCTIQESLVTIPEGLMFKSDKGIWLLTRSLTLEYIGAAVEDFNNLSITSAVSIADKNQVRFTTSDGNALIYQNFLKQWTTFTNYKAYHAIMYRNEYYFIDTNSDIQREGINYRDNSTFFPLKITSSWLKNEAQGRFRLYKTGLLGKFEGDPLLRISKYSNYDEDTPEFRLFTTNEKLDLSSWGTSDEGTYWGEGVTYGSEKDRVFQFTCEWDKQKLSSVKFVFEDLPSETLNSSYEFSNLTLQLALAQGIMNRGKEGV